MAIFLQTLRVPLTSHHLRSYVFRIPSIYFCHLFSTSISCSDDDSKDTSVSNFFRNELGSSASQANTALRSFPRIHRLRSLENVKRLHEFLKEWGFTDDQVKSLFVRKCNLMYMKPYDMKAKLEFLRSLGYSDAEVVYCAVTNPRFLSCSLEKNLVPQVHYFQRILHGNVNFARILKRNPGLLAFSLDKHVMPNINLLLEAGIEGKLLVHLLLRNPRFLNASTCSVKSYIAFVRSMDIEGSSMHFVDALSSLSSVGSVPKMEERFRFLESCGLLKDEVAKLFRKFPGALKYSIEKTRSVMEFLVKVVGVPPNIIVSCPMFIGFSLERRIKPRYRVFEYLKEIDPSYDKKEFVRLLQLTTDKFINSYVMRNPHAEVLLEILELKTRNVGMKWQLEK